ncbi:MAG: TonB-dependent receptor [Hyphomicrobiaceae bacterium]|nr:TonB-dependent receptor [Hyphomicrobiaceae bacterium]
MPAYGYSIVKSRVLGLSSLLALIAAAGPVLAQEPVALPGVTVSGATLGVKPAAPARPAAASEAAPSAQPQETVDGIPIEKVGASVSVITRADLDRQQIRNVADALRSLPGVSVSQSGTPGNVTVVRIRGGESKHTLVLVDGVEMNSTADGAFDFSNMSADDVERIEVLRGPQSGLYGNGALGGVISITTRSGRGPLQLRVQAEAGSLGTTRLGAQLSGGNANAWGSISATAYRTDGFNIATLGDEKDDTRIGTFAVKGGFALSPLVKVDGAFREQSTRAGYDDGFGMLLKGYWAPADAPYTSDARLRVASLGVTIDNPSRTWSNHLFVQGTETLRNDYSSIYSQTNSQMGKFGYKSTFLLEDSKRAPVRHYVTTLLERRTEVLDQATYPADPHHARNRNSVAGEIRGEYFNQLFLGANVRYDQNDTTENFTTWNLNGSYLVPGGVFRVHSSVGTGVKYATLYDLYGYSTIFTANPNLKSEQSFGYDVGLETKLLGGRAVVDVTYFHSDLTNEIIYNPLYTPTLVNASSASLRQGVEVAGRYALSSQITLGAAYTYLHARQDGSIQEVRRSPHQGRLDVNYASADRRGNVNLGVTYNGDMKDIVYDSTFTAAYVTLPSYWNARLAASYKLQRGVEVFGRIENLFNQHYQEVYGYNATAGTTAFAGVKLTFGGEDGIGGTHAAGLK